MKPGIGSLKDLVGKTVATPFASTSHYSLLAALTDAGVDPTKVKIIDSEPDDIYAAWSNDQIDGAYVWNPNLAKIVADGGKVLVSSAELAEKGDTTYDLGLVSTKFAEKYPDVVDAWAKAQDTAVGLIQDDLDTAAEIIGSELEIETAEAKAQIGDLIFVRAAEQAGSASTSAAPSRRTSRRPPRSTRSRARSSRSSRTRATYVAAVDAGRPPRSGDDGPRRSRPTPASPGSARVTLAGGPPCVRLGPRAGGGRRSRRPGHRAGRVRVARRSLGLREDDPPQHRRRLPRPGRGRRHRRRPARRRSRSRPGRRVPAAEPVPVAERAGQRRVRSAHGARRQGRAAPARRRRCSRWSAWRRSATTVPTSCPAACSSGRRSHGCSPPTRRCS